MRIIVIGGGPVGQLFKWAVPSAEVFEFRPPPVEKVTTRNWGANYLWAPIPGIECRSFKVITHINGAPATRASILDYKRKVGKHTEPDGDWEAQFRTESIGYEMVNYLDVPVNWGQGVERIDYLNKCVYMSSGRVEFYDALIATLPMYTTLAMCGWHDREVWRYTPIYVKVTKRPLDAAYPSDVLYVNYITSDSSPVYRATDRDGQRHFEALERLPGHPDTVRKLTPGKIWPHSRQGYYTKMLAAHNIFTFGRYGSWNSSELMHQTWERIVTWREEFIPDYAA